MPHVARAAAAEALDPEPEEQPQARRPGRKRRGGRRSYRDLQRENRELAERLGEGKGRKKQAGPEEPPPRSGPTPEELLSAQQMCAGIIRFIFNRVAKSRGPAWVMEEKEAQEIGRYWGEGLAPYLPSMAEAVPFIFGSLALGLAIDKRERLEKAQQAQPAAATVVEEPTKAEGSDVTHPEQ